MAERCTGHCCRAFVLPVTPDELWRDLWAHLQRGEDGGPDGHSGWWFDDDGERHAPHSEVETIALMVRPLGPVGTFAPPVRHPTVDPATDSARYWYSCANVLPNGDCGIYDRRPNMCRDYPYARGCVYTDCQWNAGRVDIGGDPAGAACMADSMAKVKAQEPS